MKRGRLRALVAGAVLVIASILAATLILQSERDALADQDRALARQTATLAKSVLELAGASLSGAGGIVSADGSVAPAAFDGFAREVIKSGTCLIVAYERLIAANQRTATERDLGRPLTELSQSGTRTRPESARYAPVLRILPASHRANLLGYDVLSDPARAAAFARAVDAGTPRISAPLALAVRERSPGQVVFEAVYAPGMPQRTVAERRRAFAGMVSCALARSSVEQLIDAAITVEGPFRIMDGDAVLVGQPRSLKPHAAVSTAALGRSFRVQAAVDDRGSSAIPAIIAVGGSVFGVLIALLLLQSSRREEALARAAALDERESLRRSVLFAAAGAMQLPLDAESRLELLLDSIVPGLADAAAAFNVDDGAPQVLSFRARDPSLLAQIAALDLNRRVPEMIDAIERQAPVLVRALTDEQTVAPASDAEDAQLRRDLGLASVIITPLIARGRPLGVIAVARLGDSPPYDEGDMALLQELVSHAALAIDNARLFELEHDISRTLQRALLPVRLPDTAPLQIVTRYRAAGERIEVGGDVFDVFVTGGATYVMVADVCGKGPQAAALTATARHALRARAGDLRPAAMLEHVDRSLREEDHGDRFCTMVVARFDVAPGGRRASATLSIGGHPPPLLIRAGGEVQALRITGSLIGLLDDVAFGETELGLQPGDTLLLYTDGVTESRRGREQFGEERLLATVRQHAAATLDELLDAVLSAATEFAGGEPQDDIALLAVRLDPALLTSSGERRRA